MNSCRKAEGVDLRGHGGAAELPRQSDAAFRVLNLVRPAIAEARRRQSDAAGVDVLEQLLLWDRVVDDRPVVSLSPRRSRTRSGGGPSPMKWASRFPRQFYNGRAGSGRPGCTRSCRRPAVAVVRRHRARSTSAKPGTTSYILAAGDAAERCRPSSAAGQPRLGSRSRRQFEHPLGQGSWLLSWLFSRGPIPMIGDGTTVMRVSWNRAAAVPGLGDSIVAAVAGRGRLGPVPGRAADRPVRSPDELELPSIRTRCGAPATTAPQPFSRQAVCRRGAPAAAGAVGPGPWLGLESETRLLAPDPV